MDAKRHDCPALLQLTTNEFCFPTLAFCSPAPLAVTFDGKEVWTGPEAPSPVAEEQIDLEDEMQIKLTFHLQRHRTLKGLPTMC